MQPQIEDSELTTDRGKVIGIGRVKIPKMLMFNREVPVLSFVAIKKTDGNYVSSCIHLQIDGYGNTLERAKIDMVNNICYFLYENFSDERCKDSCWINVFDLFKSNKISNELWDKYHAFQISLAEKNITTDDYSQLNQKIEQLQKKVNELEEQIKKMKICENNRYKLEIINPISPYMIIKWEEDKEVA